MNNLKSLLKQFGLKSQEAKVYLSNLQVGEAKISDIAYHCDLPRTTVASILERLEKQGLVTSHRQKGKQLYWIEDPQVLTSQVKAHLEITEKLSQELKNFYRTIEKKPQTEIYDSEKTIQHLIVKTLSQLRKGDEILTWDNPEAKNYQQIVHEEKHKLMLKLKREKNIQTKTLIPFGTDQYIRSFSKDQPIIIKILPEGIDATFSVWIVKDKVVFFSGKYPYATLIEHSEIVASMKNWFQFMWNISTNI
ncbi:hypothetical protein COT97_02600 [Candidatus Falkowbacteria bacterium CG10_big_fil_rev_8_21_14_0_10_39_11]|uniref:Transcription regulator TrmB N-terminal domain-containing protein n=1 Tax=Candidatus Falkowbacteria bacterium CG10_big_fil_rev_8_21_14_0_10_39_11 TaxID=1974565 RepID=A0A2H0V527_9BACT|nr:MAG: hypothetical protein COT97_02600 [Candidatus Falkowbacteria bacterium CG10_big_fil_rev_8_21_14_0_10_39_11]